MSTEGTEGWKRVKVVLVCEVLYDPQTFTPTAPADGRPDQVNLADLVTFADGRLVNQCGDHYQIEDVTAYNVQDFLADYAAGRINSGVPTGMTHAEWAKKQFLEELHGNSS